MLRDFKAVDEDVDSNNLGGGVRLLSQLPSLALKQKNVVTIYLT